MSFLIREPATPEQIAIMSAVYDGLLIKLAVDIEREILAGGGELHVDCEQLLLEDGSEQRNIWGADWYPQLKRVSFESIINIRPRQNNRSLDIQDTVLKDKIEKIVRKLLEFSS